MQDIAQFVQLAQTLCYDRARAEKATDGKKAKNKKIEKAADVFFVSALALWRVTT